MVLFHTLGIEQNIIVNVPLKSNANINEAIEYFNQTLQTAACINIPKSTKSRDFNYPGAIKEKKLIQKEELENYSRHLGIKLIKVLSTK